MVVKGYSSLSPLFTHFFIPVFLYFLALYRRTRRHPLPLWRKGVVTMDKIILLLLVVAFLVVVSK